MKKAIVLPYDHESTDLPKPLKKLYDVPDNQSEAKDMMVAMFYEIWDLEVTVEFDFQDDGMCAFNNEFGLAVNFTFVEPPIS